MVTPEELAQGQREDAQASRTMVLICLGVGAVIVAFSLLVNALGGWGLLLALLAALAVGAFLWRRQLRRRR